VIAVVRGLALPGGPPTSLYDTIAGIRPERGVIVPERAIASHLFFGADMSKRARKRRSRKGNAANHGRKPNA